MIQASAHSDDYVVDIKFDAAPWFAQARDRDIEDLAHIDWGGDYAADEVARFFRDGPTKRLFDYLDLSPTMPNGDPVGFECHVSPGDAMAWLQENRPALWQRLAEHFELGEEG